MSIEDSLFGTTQSGYLIDNDIKNYETCINKLMEDYNKEPLKALCDNHPIYFPLEASQKEMDMYEKVYYQVAMDYFELKNAR